MTHTFAKPNCKLPGCQNCVFLKTRYVCLSLTSKNPNSYGVSGGPKIMARTLRTSTSRQATPIAIEGSCQPGHSRYGGMEYYETGDSVHRSLDFWMPLSSYGHCQSGAQHVQSPNTSPRGHIPWRCEWFRGSTCWRYQNGSASLCWRLRGQRKHEGSRYGESGNLAGYLTGGACWWRVEWCGFEVVLAVGCLWVSEWSVCSQSEEDKAEYGMYCTIKVCG